MPRRFFRHGELPLVLLALLEARPMTAYELMGELARLFGPRYRPSPGSVYPAVDALEDENLIHGEERRGRTVYALTDDGADAFEERREALAALELRTGARVARDDSLEPLLARFRARVVPLAGRVDPDTVAAVLDRAAGEIESLNGQGNEEDA
jgi:DNA-binding PadR family transcriptional regulator